MDDQSRMHRSDSGFRSHKEVFGWPRRRFIQTILGGTAGLAVGSDRIISAAQAGSEGAAAPSDAAREYRGPRVILVRFGGGVRRLETIDPLRTYAPFFCKTLAPRGTLFSRMTIDSLEGIETSHGQGTLYIITGKYERYKDIGRKFLGQRFEARAPTVFEYVRKAFRVPPHQTLIINGEDRTDEEFYTFSNHHLFGVEFRSNVLSLYRFKTYLLRRQIETSQWSGRELEKKQKLLLEMEQLDYRTQGADRQGAAIEEFWERWRAFYGNTGLVNPRGDRLLTELTIRALKELRPKLVMVNYNDPDYVHWGNKTHYTRGISIIDQGLQQLVAAVEADDEYRGNTVFVIVPDCGRDSNPFAPVPFQHHFNSKSAHEIFALLLGPGIARGAVVDRVTDQTSIAPTIGQVMGFQTPFAEGSVLQEAFA